MQISEEEKQFVSKKILEAGNAGLQLYLLNIHRLKQKKIKQKTAHQIRNYLSGINNAECPECLMSDQLANQIEGIARDVVSLTVHSYDFKPSLRNAIRCVDFVLRSFSQLKHIHSFIPFFFCFFFGGNYIH